MKKVVCLIVAICMLCTSVIFVNATDDTEENVTDNGIVYQLQDLNSDNNELINTTQADIEAGHWNVDALGNVSPEIYIDFPMQVSSDFDNQARLNMSFTYFKVVGEDDAATFTMIDRNTGEVYYITSLSTENNYIYLENIPINKVYNLTITENFGGEESEYSAVIETLYTSAEMPTNVYIGENANPRSVSTADSISVAPVDMNEQEIVDDEGNITVIAGNDGSDITEMPANELQEYYNMLDNDSLYCIQTESNSDLSYVHYIGFFSKAMGLSNLGIFVPTHKFYYADSYSDIKPFAATGPVSRLTGSQVKNKAQQYNFLCDAKFTLPMNDNDDYIVIKHIFEEAGSYTVETLGNLQTTAEYWDASSSTSTPTYTGFVRGQSSNGGNFKQQISVVSGLVMYWVVLLEEDVYGSSIFRITSNDYPGDRSNSIYELEQENIRTTSNIVYNEDFEYAGDVDVFYVDNRTETGEYGINVTNNSSRKIDVLIQNRLNSSSTLWQVTKKTINPNTEYGYVPKINNTTVHYFVSINENSAQTSGANYDVEIISPTKGDPYEPNNTIATAKDLTEIGGYNGKINDLTLHKGDIDYFKFTTDATKKVLDIWLNKVNNIQYNMELYTYTNGTKTLIASAADSDTGDYIYLTNLSPNTTYYICINNQGLGSDKYSAALSTTLEWYIHK